MTCRALLLVSCLVGAGCHARHDERAAPTAASAVSAPRPSATTLDRVPSASVALPAASAVVEVPSPPGIPFEVAPMVQVKHKTDGQRSRTPLPEGATVALQPFVRRNLTAYVDL